jgi:ATP-dependent RNA helicase DDX51/DBP6
MEKREKSLKRAEKVAKKAAQNAAPELSTENGEPILEVPEEFHDLVPLPQPEPVPEAPVQSSTASLPSWLASPIRVSPTATASFEKLGISLEAREKLQTKGFENAFAVQAAVLPLLLPGAAQSRGDILVSAATGSGKTLAYVLPMIESIGKNTITNLRGVIIMPTRELVTQAREVCDMCSAALSGGDRKSIKVGTAIGSENFKVEQSSLVEQELHYDPLTYSEQVRKLNSKWENSDLGSDTDDDVLCDDEHLSALPYHVAKVVSKVDILICTPGRLVEHLKSTPGFTLEHVKWLVVDEADKLLDQSFQQWLDTVMGRLAPQSLLSPATNVHRVRKVILSATMTRDLGQLNSLKLYRPKLVVLEGASDEGGDQDNTHANVLPELLVEAAIKVDEEVTIYLDLFPAMLANNTYRR